MTSVPVSRYVCFLLVASSGLAWDLYSKSAVFADLGYSDLDRQIVVVPGKHVIFDAPPGTHGASIPYLNGWTKFRLFPNFNPGALWGIGPKHTWLFACFSVLAVLAVVYWLFGHRAAISWWLTVSLSLILAGTLGNLCDRIGLHGCTDAAGQPIRAVRDFLFFTFGGYHFPIFNFADSFLVTGAIMLILHSFAVSNPVPVPANVETERKEQPSPLTTTVAS